MSDQFVVGHIRTINIPDPAAGTNFTYTTPANLRLKVRGLAFHLTTDANAANRNILIYSDDSNGNKNYIVANTTNITAGLDIDISLHPGARNSSSIVNSSIEMALSYSLILVPGDTINSFIINKQATDQITAINLQVEAFILP